jgi:hypothetical protein
MIHAQSPCTLGLSDSMPSTPRKIEFLRARQIPQVDQELDTLTAHEMRSFSVYIDFAISRNGPQPRQLNLALAVGVHTIGVETEHGSTMTSAPASLSAAARWLATDSSIPATTTEFEKRFTCVASS